MAERFTSWRNPPDAELRAMLADRPVIAMVGASPRPDRPSHEVMAALLAEGYEVIPVNPTVPEVLGRACHPSLRDIPRRVDVVDVFRRSEAVPAIAEEALRRGKIKVFWMQLGIRSAAARELLVPHGIAVVEDRCLKVEHRRRVA
jgi:hypothetical protein